MRSHVLQLLVVQLSTAYVVPVRAHSEAQLTRSHILQLLIVQLSTAYVVLVRAQCKVTAETHSHVQYNCQLCTQCSFQVQWIVQHCGTSKLTTITCWRPSVGHKQMRWAG